MFPLKIVIFHSYVSLPEGNTKKHQQKIMNKPSTVHIDFIVYV